MTYPPEDFYKNKSRDRLVFWVLIVSLAVLIACHFIGCSAPKHDGPPNVPITNDATVFIRGTLSDPEVGWEHSRNDERLNVDGFEEATRRRERYMKHLTTTIRTRDRQSTHSGRVRDSYSTETRIDSK